MQHTDMKEMSIFESEQYQEMLYKMAKYLEKFIVVGDHKTLGAHQTPDRVIPNQYHLRAKWINRSRYDGRGNLVGQE